MAQNKSKEKTRSPIKTPPLAQAGDSLREELFNLVMDKALLPFILACFMIIVAGLEWSKWYWQFPPRPILTTVLALIVLCLAFFSWRFTVRKAKNLRLGIEGEIAVAQVLERLRSDGFEVFHDVIGDGFNIDHVLIGSKGIFVIETKTVTKRSAGKNTIKFDGKQIYVNGHLPDRDPVAQAIACKKWIREILKRATEQEPYIHPVILYPGWWIDREPSEAEVWVLNEKAFPKFLHNEPSRLDANEARLFASALETHLRAKASAAAR